MKEEKIKEIVYRNYNDGFHCAEAIANTIKELFPKKSDISCNAASGFCGGIGGCKQDVCGALSGGIVALGFIYGRQKGEINTPTGKQYQGLFVRSVNPPAPLFLESLPIQNHAADNHFDSDNP